MQMIIATYTFNLHVIWLTQNSSYVSDDTLMAECGLGFEEGTGEARTGLNNFSDLLLSILVQ